MVGTMMWVGLDVHARSTHAAAIDAMTGELKGCADRAVAMTYEQAATTRAR